MAQGEEFKSFLKWEQLSRDSIDVKRMYLDIAGDLVAGVLLSQIIYWYLPDKEGRTKLRVRKDGRLWLAKGRNDWWDECRITAKQYDRAIGLLEEKGLVEKRLYKFNGAPTTHISLKTDALMSHIQSILPKGEIPFYPFGEIHFNLSGNSLTENTAKNTTKKKTQTASESDEQVRKPEPQHLSSKGKKQERLQQKSPDSVDRAIQRVMNNESARGKKGVVKKVPPRNANTMIAYFDKKFKEYLGGKAPLETGKDKKLLKDMIGHYGYDYVASMIDWMFRNWAKFVREKKIKGVPTVGILYGFRAYLQDHVADKTDADEEGFNAEDGWWE